MIFRQTLRVLPADIDQLGHVNNIRYLTWVQEIAVAHWQAEAPESDQQSLLWVVLRHEIDYLRPAFLDDELEVSTWVGSAKRLRFERNTEILRLSDGALISKASTVWCPIDATTKRPVQVSAEVRALFSA